MIFTEKLDQTKLEQEIKLLILDLHFMGFKQPENEYTRKLCISHVDGEYGHPAYFIFTVEGTPVRGTLVISHRYKDHFFISGGKCVFISYKKKYKKLYELIEKWKLII